MLRRCLTDQLINEIGNQYGRLTVIRRAENDKNGTPKWVCRCSCGATTIVYGHHLRSGATKSCGCLRREADRGRRLPKGRAAMRALYRHYQQNAKQDSRAWELTEEQFEELSSAPCFYCGVPPKQRTNYEHYYGNYEYNGLDRKDSSQGYTFSNVVPCCSDCNYLKSGRGYLEFLEKVRKIAQYQGW